MTAEMQYDAMKTFLLNMTSKEELFERAEAAEDALREIALFCSCGGYNDEGPLDVAKFVAKIKEAIIQQ